MLARAADTLSIAASMVSSALVAFAWVDTLSCCVPEPVVEIVVAEASLVKPRSFRIEEPVAAV